MSSSLLRLLPGFRLAADRVRQALQAGTSVVLARPSHGPSNVGSELALEIGPSVGPDELRPSGIEIRDEFDILASLWRHYGGVDAPPQGTVETFMESGMGAWEVAYIDVEEATSANVWLGFLTKYAQHSALTGPGERATLLVCVPEHVLPAAPAMPSMTTLRVIPWDELLTRADARVMAQHLAVEDSTGGLIWRSLKANAIAVLAGTDIMLAEALAVKTPPQYDDLSAFLREFAARVGHRPDGISPEPASRVAPPNNGEQAHILDYVGSSKLEEELSRRLWQAQIEALYPHLEIKRRHTIDRYRDLLSVPHRRPNGDTVVEKRELELSDIVAQLRRIRDPGLQSTLNRVMFLRDVRNALAHFEALSFGELLQNRNLLEN